MQIGLHSLTESIFSLSLSLFLQYTLSLSVIAWPISRRVHLEEGFVKILFKFFFSYNYFITARTDF